MTKKMQALLGIAAAGAGVVAGVVVKSTCSLIQEHIYMNMGKAKNHASGRQLKVLHFTDVHLGMPYSFPRFKKMVKQMQSLSPDVIVCTGDLIDNPKYFASWKKLEDLLGQMKAPLGKYAIWGNHEKKGINQDAVERVYANGGFKLLCNECKVLQLTDRQNLTIYGLDDILKGDPDLSILPKNKKADTLALLLLHEPDAAKIASHYGVDLILAGHSHGGQILFPKIGAVVRPLLSQKMLKGLYEFNGKRIYVNSGLGTTAVPFRMLCEPQYSVLHIEY
ncbi:MAG: metallophosphoesterase [Oscillospiraceae bacterium]